MHYGNDYQQAAIVATIDGGGVAVTAGMQTWVEIPYDCNIEAARITAQPSGSAVVDLWLDTYANFPPTNADTITNSNELTLSSQDKAEKDSAQLASDGWTRALTKGEWLMVNVDSATTVEIVVIALEVLKT